MYLYATKVKWNVIGQLLSDLYENQKALSLLMLKIKQIVVYDGYT